MFVISIGNTPKLSIRAGVVHISRKQRDATKIKGKKNFCSTVK